MKDLKSVLSTYTDNLIKFLDNTPSDFSVRIDDTQVTDTIVANMINSAGKIGARLENICSINITILEENPKGEPIYRKSLELSINWIVKSVVSSVDGVVFYKYFSTTDRTPVTKLTYSDNPTDSLFTTESVEVSTEDVLQNRDFVLYLCLILDTLHSTVTTEDKLVIDLVNSALKSSFEDDILVKATESDA